MLRIWTVSVCALFMLSCSNSAIAPTITSPNGTTAVNVPVSASEIAVSSVGGTLVNTSSTSTLATHSDNTCPTLFTANGAGCSNVTGQEVQLTYNQCNSSGAVFNGADLIEAPAGVACGSYPAVPNNYYLGHAYTGTRTSVTGTVVNFVGDGANYTGTPTISVGEAVFFSGGIRNKVSIAGAHYTITGKMDHTVAEYNSTALTLSYAGTTATVNGSLLVYHNLEKVTGIVTFDNVIYSAACCLPMGGQVTTAFSAGPNGNPASAYVNKTEAMTFGGTCGQATYTDINGTTSAVTLSHCL